jgi:hypothetical protein
MRRFLLLLLVLSCAGAFAQPSITYGGERKFDGVHQNEIYGNLIYGGNTVTGRFFGEAASYTRHFTERWSITAGEQAQFLKNVYSFDVMGTYRIPFKRTSLYLDTRIADNIYHQWHVNEVLINASAYWETNYVDLRFGVSFIHFHKNDVKEQYQSYTDASYTELPTLTVGFGVNIRPRNNPWNLGLYIRNFDQYYYENWNINWGLRFHATLPWNDIKIYSEFNIRPAGSMSQLATRYETSLRVGLKYAW